MEHNWNEKKAILLKTIEGFPIITITMRKGRRGKFLHRVVHGTDGC